MAVFSHRMLMNSLKFYTKDTQVFRIILLFEGTLFQPTDKSYVWKQFEYSFIHSFILAISIGPLQVLYHSEALPTTARILYRRVTPKRTGNCRYSNCSRS